MVVFFFFKQKTAYEMRISDWSSDVCSSDLFGHTFSQELTFSSASSNQFHWVGGLFYYYDYSAFEPLTVENVVSLIGLVKTHAYAAFGELTYEILPRLTVIGGVRYSSERKRYEGSLVPALPSKIAAKTFSDEIGRAHV